MDSDPDDQQEKQESEGDEQFSKKSDFDDEQANNKSIYQTFMDVSSIFSKPILAFGKQRSGTKNKSRFFNEELEKDDDDLLLDQLNPAALDNPNAFQEDGGQPVQNSIFSSGNLFPNSQQQQPR